MIGDGVVCKVKTGDGSGRRPACQALDPRLEGRHRGPCSNQEMTVDVALRGQLASDGSHGGGEARAAGEGSPRKSTQLPA